VPGCLHPSAVPQLQQTAAVPANYWALLLIVLWKP